MFIYIRPIGVSALLGISFLPWVASEVRAQAMPGRFTVHNGASPYSMMSNPYGAVSNLKCNRGSEK
jgi:streptogramin lyase